VEWGLQHREITLNGMEERKDDEVIISG